MNTYKKGKFLTLFSVLSLLPFSAISAKDPIGWQLSGQFANPAQIGITYSVTYTFTNQLPLTLVHPLLITIGTNSDTEFSAIDGCSGALLNPQETCDVTIFLTPSVTGEKDVQVLISGYDNNVVPLPLLTTTATSPIWFMPKSK